MANGATSSCMSYAHPLIVALPGKCPPMENQLILVSSDISDESKSPISKFTNIYFCVGVGPLRSLPSPYRTLVAAWRQVFAENLSCVAVLTLKTNQ
ncbi:unnamed protein product [Albugo candida]|uniref:Uncharacterized protein n=1 Tax=Albugo candida TaxID=65357 RepID=A0A024GBY3_9STRA|nr:unnamed protein product [Albugo candida]|eukprot:CCI44184.1 unnamed protein product [Albugo candida]